MLVFLRDSANAKNSSASLTWDAINQIGRDFEVPYMDEHVFVSRYESDPEIQKLVAKYDKYGITISTNKAIPEPQLSEPESEVSKMAKHAIRKRKK